VPADVVEGIERVLADVVAQMSHWDAGSALSRYNQAPRGTWHAMPGDFMVVLECALSVARLSGGAYDPTAGALVNAWGFGARQRHDETGFEPPSADTIAALMRPGRSGWRDIDLSIRESRVSQPGVMLDFSAIAKGHAVDLVSQHLSDRGLIHHMVEIGGELRGEGMKPDLQPWWVEMEWPAAQATDTSHAPPLMALHGLSVATSGDYRRFFMKDGVRHAHTIDPRFGQPLRHGLASVTAVHRSCMHADALSTALNVLGLSEGMAWAREHGIAACFVQRDGDALVSHLSPAFQAMLE
jgi:thiamine biosynthesis lipoprotein